MSFYPQPKFSKSRIDTAGYRFAAGEQTVEDLQVLENWRASHAHVMNTFRQILYNRLKKAPAKFVQRLKRSPTIIDKLSRDPRMAVRLSQMQDIAGSRLIFENLHSLRQFRTLMSEANFSHQLRWSKDYILGPKVDGYRGVHDIYGYNVQPKKGRAGEEQPWNGLRIEIQYRTNIQNVWATAVETAGHLTSNNPKFHKGSEAVIDFFKICSELLARSFEDATGPLPSMDILELRDEYDRLSELTHIIDIFENVSPAEFQAGSKRFAIIALFFPGASSNPVEVKYHESVVSAINDYNETERRYSGLADVVLVRAEESEQIRQAYKNYFTDTVEFVRLVREARG